VKVKVALAMDGGSVIGAIVVDRDRCGQRSLVIGEAFADPHAGIDAVDLCRDGRRDEAVGS